MIPRLSNIFSCNRPQSNLSDLPVYQVRNNATPPHTFFSGIRSVLRPDPFETESAPLAKSQFLQQKNLRNARRILENLEDNQVGLITIGSALHTALVIKTDNKYSHIDVGGSGIEHGLELDKAIEALANSCQPPGDIVFNINMNKYVAILGLNVERIKQYVDEQEFIFEFNQLTKNCARFSSNALLEGLPTELRNTKFKHDKSMQMPLNAYKLAIEIRERIQHL